MGIYLALVEAVSVGARAFITVTIGVSVGSVGSSEILEFVSRIGLDGLSAFGPVGGANFTMLILRWWLHE